MRAGLALLATFAALITAAGCGTAGREDDVRAVAERFATAIDRGDGAAACALLTAPARQQLVSDERKPCSDAVTGLDIEPSRVDRVDVAITSAAAHYARGGRVYLDETTHGWRIAAAGCEPKPGDEPDDCELSS